VALAGGCAVTATRPTADDDAVSGPAWKTSARRGVGAATAAAPARLVGVAAEDHQRYDRIVFSFDGERPGYRVAYSPPPGPGAGPRLRITLDRASSDRERRLTPRLPAVREVHQRPDAGRVVETIVSVAASGADDRLPFRVGLSVGGFYVDIAHPDEET
jgi:hypothetical protein